MSNSVQPHRQQPTRLRGPWDSPGKNTGVGGHFLLQCMQVKSESEVPQLCPTLRDRMNRSLPGSSVHGIFQARVLEWGATASSNACMHAKFLQSCTTLCDPIDSSPCSCKELDTAMAMAPTPVRLPGRSHGRRSLVGCSPWGRCELDTTQ